MAGRLPAPAEPAAGSRRLHCNALQGQRVMIGDTSDQAALVRRAVVGAIAGAAPERRAAVEAVFEELNPNIVRLDDRPGFKLEGGGFKSVLLTQRTLDQFWILGHVAWQSIAAYAPVLVNGDGLLEIGSVAIDALPGQEAEERHIAEGLTAVTRLRDVLDHQTFTWPQSIPRPSPIARRTVQEQAVADLLVIAIAYTLLHELHHVKCADEALRFPSSQEEELACDDFARRFLLDAVDMYARESGEDRIAVLQKRGAGIAVGCFVLGNVTHRSAWAGTESHPPLAKRLRLLSVGIAVPKNGLYWSFFGSLLLSIVRLGSLLPEHLAVADWEDGCAKLIGLIEAVPSVRGLA